MMLIYLSAMLNKKIKIINGEVNNNKITIKF